MLKVNTRSRELLIYSELGPSFAGMISALDIVEALEELGPGDITVRLNSPGGTADEAFAAVEHLKRHDGNINVTIDSLAASAATFFLNEEFRVSAAPTSRVMIHYASTLTYGTARDHLQTVKVLNAYDASIVESYKRIKRSKSEIEKMLEDETWLSAKEALALGLIDSIDDGIKTDPEAKTIRIAAGRYRNTPKDLLAEPTYRERQRTPSRDLAARKLAALKLKVSAR